MLGDWDAGRVAAAAGGRLLHAGDAADAGAEPGPVRVVVDSREAGPGDLFVGLAGERTDGGRFALAALDAGAWGALVDERRAEALVRGPDAEPRGAVIGAADPLAALGALARSWRRELDSVVIGVTGSTGKTSTKDVLAAMIALERRVVATPRNWNTEIGLPLTVLAAPAGTEVLVLEMAMRGPGQIAELALIAEPDVGVVTNVGPVHLEQMGSLEAIADEKASLLEHLRAGGTAVVPADDELIAARVPARLRVATFGPGGDVDALPAGLRVGVPGARLSAHMRRNALAALAAARAAGLEPRGVVDVALSELRGQRHELPDGTVVVNDCYNANPMSMRAALDDLAASAPGRRVAVLGDMLELGPGERRFHEEIGAHAAAAGVELLVAVGPRARAIAAGYGGAGEVHEAADAADAAALVPGLLRAGDTVLVKASRGVALEAVAAALETPPRPPAG